MSWPSNLKPPMGVSLPDGRKGDPINSEIAELYGSHPFTLETVKAFVSFYAGGTAGRTKLSAATRVLGPPKQSKTLDVPKE